MVRVVQTTKHCEVPMLLSSIADHHQLQNHQAWTPHFRHEIEDLPAAAQVRDVAHGPLRLDAVPDGQAVQVAAHLAALQELGVDPRAVHLCQFVAQIRLSAAVSAVIAHDAGLLCLVDSHSSTICHAVMACCCQRATFQVLHAAPDPKASCAP
jgi:hypothetical protein